MYTVRPPNCIGLERGFSGPTTSELSTPNSVIRIHVRHMKYVTKYINLFIIYIIYEPKCVFAEIGNERLEGIQTDQTE